MMDLKSPCNWDVMEWEAVRPGVKRKVYQAAGGTLVLNHLEPGHSPRPHSHPHEQIVYILQGEAEFTVHAKVFNLRSGSLLTIPPNAEHFARVTGEGDPRQSGRLHPQEGRLPTEQNIGGRIRPWAAIPDRLFSRFRCPKDFDPYPSG